MSYNLNFIIMKNIIMHHIVSYSILNENLRSYLDLCWWVRKSLLVLLNQLSSISNDKEPVVQMLQDFWVNVKFDSIERF